MSDKPEALWIESTRGPDDEPACLLTWRPLQWYADVAAVRETAADMVTCAAYADMMMELVRIGLPPGTVSGFATSLLAGRDKRFFGTKDTVTLTPAGSSKRREALVLLQRGSRKGAVTSAEARGMASQWLGAAEATESDQLVTEALRACGADEGMQERVFGYLRKLRPAGHSG